MMNSLRINRQREKKRERDSSYESTMKTNDEIQRYVRRRGMNKTVNDTLKIQGVVLKLGRVARQKTKYATENSNPTEWSCRSCRSPWSRDTGQWGAEN